MLFTKRGAGFDAFGSFLRVLGRSVGEGNLTIYLGGQGGRDGNGRKGLWNENEAQNDSRANGRLGTFCRTIDPRTGAGGVRW